MAKKRTSKKYKAAKGAQFSQGDAQAIGQHLETLEVVTPQAVLADATKKRSPLHKHFEWDDSVAAERHRLQQARNLVNHLVVVVVINGVKQDTKAFHNVTVEFEYETEGDIYAPVSVVKKNEALAKQVVRKAYGELKAWERRYKQYAEVFGSVFGAIDDLDADAAA